LKLFRNWLTYLLLTVGFWGGLFGGLFLTNTSEASTAQVVKREFVNVAPGRDLYVDYLMPEAGKPTVVLLNGLTYTTKSWDVFVKKLQGDGLGILRIDLFGMGQTLLRYAPIQNVISYRDQVRDVQAVLVNLKIKEPVTLVGLSYGGGIAMIFAAQYPDMVQNCILMSPYTEPLESQDQLLRLQVNQTRLLNPFNPMSDEEVYDYYLHNLVYATYPSAEPGVLQNPYILESLYRMTQSIRHFKADDVSPLFPKGKMHLMVAKEDQYIPAPVLERFWNLVPVSARGSRVFVEHSEHKIPEAVPSFAASWVRLILQKDARLSGGSTFEAKTYEGEAVNLDQPGNAPIKVSKDP
jgi:pimeloyl-ACP methyl ester carboxylesterase